MDGTAFRTKPGGEKILSSVNYFAVPHPTASIVLESGLGKRCFPDQSIEIVEGASLEMVVGE